MAAAYLTAAMLIDGPGRFSILRRAVADGWHGRLGKM